MAADLNTPEPAPKPGRAPSTWLLVLTDMTEREQLGRDKYGTFHQHDNGRDHLVDAYQECLDLALYLRAEIERRRRATPSGQIGRGPEIQQAHDRLDAQSDKIKELNQRLKVLEALSPGAVSDARWAADDGRRR